MLPVKFSTGDPDYDPDEARLARRSERIIKDLKNGTDLLEQHERNAVRQFHRWLMSVRPNDLPVAALATEMPWLVEPEEPHDAKRCPACHES